MTEKECIKQLESLIDSSRSMAAGEDPDEIWKRDTEALEMAIEAMKERQRYGLIKDITIEEVAEALYEYSQIGVIEKLQELKERDTPKKIELINGGISVCPECGAKVNRCYAFCKDCGQKLDWSRR